MRIISHRGYWLHADEKNHRVAFERSFDLGFGTETDVRDCAGELLISHDPPGGQEMRLDELLTLLGGRSLPLAINIKADGLASRIGQMFKQHGVTDWFAFDMSIPDMRSFLRAGLPVYTRMSEVEREAVWLQEAQGVWLDGFQERWYDDALLDALLTRNKPVCVVSAELHGREAEPFWAWLHPYRRHPGLTLCTDFPEQAVQFFARESLP